MKIKNPKLTLNVGDDVTGFAYALDDNNELVGIGIAPNHAYETVVLCLYDDVEYKFVGAGLNSDVEISDAVNCTLEDGTIFITDPTKDASCAVAAIPPLG